MDIRIVVAVACAVAGAGVACQDSPGIALRYDRTNTDPTEHVFPTDLYLGAQGVIDAFSEDQYRALPFLTRLRATAQQGWSAVNAIRVPFTPVDEDADRWLDPDTLAGAFALYRTSAEPPAPVDIGELELSRATNSVLVRPRVPFTPGRYALVVRDGVLATRDGGPVSRSRDYEAIVQSGDPATAAAFNAVAAVDPAVSTRADTLAFLEMTVVDQTESMTLLRSYVDGKVAVDDAGADELLDVTPWDPLDARELAAEGGQVLAQGDEAVRAFYEGVGLGALDTAAVDRIIIGRIATPNFISDPISQLLEVHANQTFKGRVLSVPFGASNPLSLSASAPSRALPYLLVMPKAPAGTPAPVVIAVHGVSRAKEDWLALAPALAGAGLAVIAIELYQHGARQRDIAVPEGDFAGKLDAGLAALDVDFPDPFVNPTFLARTRDKLRQSVVDHLALIRLLSEADGATAIIDLDGDGAPDDWGPVHLVGHSLGAMIGTVLAAVSPDLERAVLSAPGGPLAAIVSASPALAPDVDLLLYLTANAPSFGLLAGTDRRLLPDSDAREIFGRVAEVTLAPVDPLTFAAHVTSGALGNGGRRVLLQLPARDLVVPASASARLARAMAAGAGDPGAFPVVAPELFPTGLATATELGAAGGVTQLDGGHGLLLDFVDPAVTAAAQAQAIGFLLAP